MANKTLIIGVILALVIVVSAVALMFNMQQQQPTPIPATTPREEPVTKTTITTPTPAKPSPTTPRPSPTPTPTETQVAEQKPVEVSPCVREGGTLVIANIADVLRLDPALITDVPTANVAELIFEFLVDVAPNGTFIPGLAERWEVSPDAKEWTFYLRKGVKFHDGTPFNATAVKFTAERTMDPETQSPDGELFRNTIERVEVIDEYTVKFVLKKPSAGFISQIVRNQGLMIVSPTAAMKYGKDFSKNPVGTGPFMFVEWVPGDRVVLKRFDEYWKGKPCLEEIIIKPIPESSVQVASLLAGDVDVIYAVSREDLDRLERSPDVVVYKVPGFTVFGIVFNVEHEFFKDVRVRQALNYAVDKDAIVETLFKGIAVRTYGPLPPSSPYYTENVNKFPYDPEKAAQLLEEAGWKLGDDGIRYKDGKPFKFSIILQEGKEAEELVQAVAEYWRRIGVIAELQILEYGTWVDKLVSHDFEAGYIWWSAGSPDPDNFLPFLFRSDGWANVGLYSNPKVDELIDKVSITPDFEERKRYAEEAQRLIVEDSYWIFIYSGLDIIAMRDYVKNYVHSPFERDYTFVYLEKE